jgi:hypothetical protein
MLTGKHTMERNMERQVFSPEEAEELKRLCAELAAASELAGAILARHGMESPEFQAADKATGDLWRRIRNIHGISDQHWMAS